MVCVVIMPSKDNIIIAFCHGGRTMWAKESKIKRHCSVVRSDLGETQRHLAGNVKAKASGIKAACCIDRGNLKRIRAE